MPTKDRYTAQKNIDRYNNLISGRLNPTENTFNKGVFVISFN